MNDDWKARAEAAEARVKRLGSSKRTKARMKKDADTQLQFYMQITAALLRRLGGQALVLASEFENPAKSIMHRVDTDANGIRLVVVENDHA